jgi:hypothetical protein
VSSQTQPTLRISSLLKREVRPILLLGAGASARSGIPVAEDLFTEIIKWGYSVAHARNEGDPTLMRSDWWPWLERQDWFRANTPLSDQYPKAVEAILKPRQDRKTFFQRVLNPRIPASRGYQILAQLMARRVFSTVLSTNFDQLLAKECHSTASIYGLAEIRTPDDFKLLSTHPSYPQIVYLHGSVDHYTDQNLETETQQLNADLVEQLFPILRDHPLVVVGYRGAEPSVMRHLLMDQAKRCNQFSHGVYWCHRAGTHPTATSPLVAQLAATIGGNLQFVEIRGFDELMEELDRQLPEFLTSLHSDLSPTSAGSDSEPATNDLQSAETPIDTLDDALLRAKLVAYCEAVRLPKPDLTSIDSLLRAMADRSLVVRNAAGWTPTRGGQLLFVKDSKDQLPTAHINVLTTTDIPGLTEILERASTKPSQEKADGDDELIRINGNLWVQLDDVASILSQVNRPFRLKEAASRSVHPYPPLALKELLTNMLAHRDYTSSEPSTITVSRESIRFENPGGLTDHVRRQLPGLNIQAAIEASHRGIKGYRNPVIADFFFSAGAMDKEGSGLPDALAEAQNNLNELHFGPVLDNTRFEAIIRCRPEALEVDVSTRTARTQQSERRYSPNLVAVARWPDRVWKLGTTVVPKDLPSNEDGALPAFCMFRDWLWTFADPNSPATAPLRAISIDEEIHHVPSAELVEDPRAFGAVPWLLNAALAMHLEALGLRVRREGARMRAHFPAADGLAREVTYRGRFKQATRTVAKPIVSRSSGKLIYWEHKAVGLRFERFGTQWSLCLLPCYSFTLDGDTAPIESRRIGPLATKRAARDYNSAVLHDIVFWARILASGSDSTFRLPLDATRSCLTPRTDVGAFLEISAMVPTVSFQATVDVQVVESQTSDMTEAEISELEAAIEHEIEDRNAAETLDGD